MKFFITVLLAVFSYLFTASAQEQSEYIKTKVSIVGHNLDKKHSAFYIGSKRVRVGVSYTIVNKPVSYEGSVNLGIYDRHTVEYDDEGKELPPITSCRLPQNQKEVILLILGQGKGNKKVYKTYPIPASLNKFPVGSKILINLTSVPIRGQIGKAPYKLNKPENIYFKLPAASKKKGLSTKYLEPMKGTRNEAFAVKLEYKDGDKWKNLKQTRWFETSFFRKIMFFFPTEDGKRVVMKNVSHKDRSKDEQYRSDDQEALKKRLKPFE